jgi:hypothetical protein
MAHEKHLVGFGDDQPFELRLAQAIAWCASHADLSTPSTSLRSSELYRPSQFPGSRTSAVHGVVWRREVAVGKTEPVRSADDLAGGRLLVYLPDEQLADGAAEVESNGFFDVENVPPWDTWVADFHYGTDFRPWASDVLISWVPPEFVGLADQGINVNPEECIHWLTESDAPVAAELRARELISG